MPDQYDRFMSWRWPTTAMDEVAAREEIRTSIQTVRKQCFSRQENARQFVLGYAKEPVQCDSCQISANHWLQRSTLKKRSRVGLKQGHAGLQPSQLNANSEEFRQAGLTSCLSLGSVSRLETFKRLRCHDENH